MSTVLVCSLPLWRINFLKIYFFLNVQVYTKWTVYSRFIVTDEKHTTAPCICLLGPEFLQFVIWTSIAKSMEQLFKSISHSDCHRKLLSFHCNTICSMLIPSATLTHLWSNMHTKYLENSCQFKQYRLPFYSHFLVAAEMAFPDSHSSHHCIICSSSYTPASQFITFFVDSTSFSRRKTENI